MPKIRWTDLPPSLRQHLFDRVADRQITAADLYKLKLWRETGPDAPDGPWYKDFGSFKICGEGEFPKTFLLKGQPAKANCGIAIGCMDRQSSTRSMSLDKARQLSKRRRRPCRKHCDDGRHASLLPAL